MQVEPDCAFMLLLSLDMSASRPARTSCDLWNQVGEVGNGVGHHRLPKLHAPPPTVMVVSVRPLARTSGWRRHTQK